MFEPPRGGPTVCPYACNDNLWWTHSLNNDRAQVTSPNSGSRMLVGRNIWWTIGRWMKQTFTDSDQDPLFGMVKSMQFGTFGIVI